jgi:5-methylthioadenosine/S-adenosylhomocysteine deaminase
MAIIKQALRGRIAQMDAAFTVIADGIVWIDGDKIVAVTATGHPPPAGFENIAVETTGGTIFPGLIELHNHLSYNMLRLWKVPKLYTNRDQWGSHPDYRKLISGPTRVLGATAGFPEAITRFVECKCLLAGVTASQGITLQSVHLERFYRGVVRNVEAAVPPLPSAHAKISDVEATDAAKFLAALKKTKCSILHLSEGTDAKARAHFTDLKLPNDKWAIASSLAGIHCVGLEREDFDVMAQFGASMVWSPLSNLLLYGQTAKVEAAKAAGVTLALGPDWAPSGSKNLLAELKIAKIVSGLKGGLFSDREIVAMATRSAAKMLRWDNLLGSLEAGKLADLLVIEGAAGDSYAQLIKASEGAIRLVMIAGVRRLAVQELSGGMMGIEAFKVDGKTVNLNLHDAASDPIVEGLTLAAAIGRLSDGLKNIKMLAAALEHPQQPMAGTPKHLLAAAARPAPWRLVLDHEEEHGESIRPRFANARQPAPVARLSTMAIHAAAAQPLSHILVPLELDAITVSDDVTYLPRLREQKNLPAELVEGL